VLYHRGQDQAAVIFTVFLIYLQSAPGNYPDYDFLQKPAPHPGRLGFSAISREPAVEIRFEWPRCERNFVPELKINSHENKKQTGSGLVLRRAGRLPGRFHHVQEG
jgi:hypothetical protein